jgi:hypothetical protein
LPFDKAMVIVKTFLPDIENWNDGEAIYRVDRLLRLLDIAMKPGEPKPKKMKAAEPLSEQYEEFLASIPGARDFENMLDAGLELSDEESANLSMLWPHLPTSLLEKLDDLHKQGKPLLRQAHWAQMKYVLDLRKRTEEVAGQYGGIMFVPQALAIHFFLGEALSQCPPIPRSAWKTRDVFRETGNVRALPESTKNSEAPDTASTKTDSRRLLHDGRNTISQLFGSSVLGPKEVAALLRSGMATTVQGRAVQQNQLMLVMICASQPKHFLLGVLAELSGGSLMTLTAVLVNLLELPQDRMKQQVDVSWIFSRKLGLNFPSRDEYMAGKSHCWESYSDELRNVSQQLLEQCKEYHALRTHLCVYRRAPKYFKQQMNDFTLIPESVSEKRFKKAVQLITEADAAGQAYVDFYREHYSEMSPRMSPRRLLQKERLNAEAKYRAAWAACKDCVESGDQFAITRGEMRNFFQMNYQALMIKSIIDDVRNNVEKAQDWFRKYVTFYVEPYADLKITDQDLNDDFRMVDLIIESVYVHEEDRKELRACPLVWMLIGEPEEDRYDITLVSAMGVVTDGAQGQEMATSFKRLEEKRGVKMHRADTGTARDHHFNAKQIKTEVMQIKGDWCYVGYSQGCANALLVETELMGGNREERDAAERLRTRNLLFSAANGSPHGTCGEEKAWKVTMRTENFGKHLQATNSDAMVTLFMNLLKNVLNLQEIVHALGGMASFFDTKIENLWREGQHRVGVPTLGIIGSTDENLSPACLQYLSSQMDRQLPADDRLHDTQVSCSDSVGHCTDVDNANNEMMKLFDFVKFTQRTHHWSPLLKEAEFVETEEDRENHRFDFPKDRHIFPWLEVSARFGIIKKKSKNQRNGTR